MEEKPNILFIMTDHQREDSIGMVQCGREVTPNLNRLSEQSVVFKRAYNACPLCVPARTALATGKYPTANGVVVNDWKGVSSGDHKPLHQYLLERGYNVGHVGVDHIKLTPALKDRMQFGIWESEITYGEYAASRGINAARNPGELTEVLEEVRDGRCERKKYSNTLASVWPFGIEYFKDYYFCEKSLEFIRKKHETPFALFTYFWAPHPPLRVPEPYASLYDPAQLELPENIGLPAEGEPSARRKGVPAQLAEGIGVDEWRKVWAAHLGLVTLADALIGRIVKQLEDNGQLENTIIVFTSDHGDSLGQHRMYQKMEMYEQAVKVPLLIRAPGIEPHRISSPVSHLDIVPTLLELAGIGQEDRLDGLSLVETMRHGVENRDRKVFCQYSGNPDLGCIRRAVISSRFKYIYDGTDERELYDLEEDRLEMRNLANDPGYGNIVRELHEECRKWNIEHKDWIKY